MYSVCMADDDLRPSARAAIAALFDASALLDPIRFRFWDYEGLTITQLRLLNFLAEEEGLGNAELADRLYVTRPSVSALLERLERGGFIRREVSPYDRRGIRIWLEERGRQAITNVRTEARDYAAGLISSLNDRQLDEIAAALGTLVEAGRARLKRDASNAHGGRVAAGR